MSLSIQTNTASIAAQENLRVNSTFQTQTIQRLTSGYRINSASDDAAGLAVANKFRNDIAELTQGVRNANDGLSQLQITDGGLSNIANILDRLKTLATESATNTFSGNRSTLNNEYKSLLGEIDRQASNVGLVNNGTMNKKLQVYIGGGSSQANAQVNVDLSGGLNQVDSAGLSIGSTSIDAGGVALNGNAVTNLNNANLMALTSTGGSAVETFAFKYVDSTGTTQSLNATVTASAAAGITVSNALSQLNTQISAIGLQASVNSSGALVVGGTGAFELTGVTNNGAAGLANTLVTDGGITNTINTGDYNYSAAYTQPGTTNEIIGISNGSVTQYVTFDATAGTGTTTAQKAADAINAATRSMGIYAFADAANNVNVQGSGSFTITQVQKSTTAGWSTAAAGTQFTLVQPNSTQSPTGNALSALTAITAAIGQLGQIQGRVGAGENQLNYAIGLAQSQITNFSSAQAQIRDTDVAAEAANLTKAQVLQQASIAAMAQANSAPQAVLSLLKG